MALQVLNSTKQKPPTKKKKNKNNKRKNNVEEVGNKKTITRKTRVTNGLRLVNLLTRTAWHIWLELEVHLAQLLACLSRWTFSLLLYFGS